MGYLLLVDGSNKVNLGRRVHRIDVLRNEYPIDGIVFQPAFFSFRIYTVSGYDPVCLILHIPEVFVHGRSWELPLPPSTVVCFDHIYLLFENPHPFLQSGDAFQIGLQLGRLLGRLLGSSWCWWRRWRRCLLRWCLVQLLRGCSGYRPRGCSGRSWWSRKVLMIGQDVASGTGRTSFRILMGHSDRYWNNLCFGFWFRVTLPASVFGSVRGFIFWFTWLKKTLTFFSCPSVFRCCRALSFL